ncbi:MAG: hypothetical protein R3C59_05770 [Planctomycetaceae bacterium]
MHRLSAQLVIISLLSVTGCALMGTGRDGLFTETRTLRPDQVADFERDVPIRRVVRLDTGIVSARSTDRRVRELVWEEMDESGLMSPEDRRRLNQSGIRVGVSGGNPPWALSSLLSGDRVQPTNAEMPVTQTTVSHSSTFGTQLTMAEGSQSQIELPRDGKSLAVPSGRIAGLDGIELTNARCVLQMTPTEYGDGWVVIHVLPQIHHGTKTARYSVSADGEQMPTRQQIRPLYEQQFQLKLHNSETVVIGHQQQDDWTVGRMMFQCETLSATQECLIVLQLKQIEEVKGQKSVTVDYRKY